MQIFKNWKYFQAFLHQKTKIKTSEKKILCTKRSRLRHCICLHNSTYVYLLYNSPNFSALLFINIRRSYLKYQKGRKEISATVACLESSQKNIKKQMTSYVHTHAPSHTKYIHKYNISMFKYIYQ